MIRTVEIEEYCCDKCGHVWRSQTIQLPKICARCKSAKWNEHSASVAVEVTRPTITPTDDRQAKLEALRAMIAPLESAPAVQSAPVASAWKFTGEKPQYDETTGNVYRQQYDTANPKRRRAVQVDENDHEKIID